MNYRINPKNGDKLSILGFGCMRFPKDEKETEKQIIYAIEHGINYFDTAYIYPGSEVTLGRILAKGYRDRVHIATKLPPYFVKKREDLDKIFNEELKRLQTDRIDYYFIHMLTDLSTWERMVGLGIVEWIAEKKRLGQIRNIGFSYHGGKDEFIRIADAFDWEFCMIQYNYFDEHIQAGRIGLQYAHEKGLPVMIMEPLKGGTLVNNMPKEVTAAWQSAHVRRSPAEWAFRWLWNQPEVTTVLSGMNSMEMIEENIRAAGEAQAGEFTPEDEALFEKVRGILHATIKVPCTGCNYCMPCPVGVNIPICFAAYNNREVEGKLAAEFKYISQWALTVKPSNASLCIKCGKCEQHCPQNIPIRKELDNVRKKMEGFYYKPMRWVIKQFMLK